MHEVQHSANTHDTLQLTIITIRVVIDHMKTSSVLIMTRMRIIYLLYWHFHMVKCGHPWPPRCYHHCVVLDRKSKKVSWNWHNILVVLNPCIPSRSPQRPTNWHWSGHRFGLNWLALAWMSWGDGMDEQRCSYEALIAHTTCYLRLLAWTCQRLVELGIR